MYIFLPGCLAISSEENDCCTRSKPCVVGEGDCDNDNECHGNLKCGEGKKGGRDNNCKKLFNSTWHSEADCCYDPYKIDRGDQGCPATSKWDDGVTECCSSSNPCEEGEGDCDNDNECRGNLKCGDLVEDRNNNCKKHFNSIWNFEADCCYDPNTLGILNINRSL